MNTSGAEYETEMEIDLREVLFVLRRRIAVILLVALLGATAAFGVTKYFMTPKYTSTSMVYIFSKSTSITSLADLQIGSQLTVDFETIGTSRPVMERVISGLGLDMNYEGLRKIVSISNPSSSRILKISVTHEDPVMACDICNAMADSVASRVAEVLETDKPSTVEEAVVADKPSSPRTRRNVLLGAMLGFLIAAAFVLIRHFSDMTIKDEDDVERDLGLSTLAAIPNEGSLGSEISRSRKHRKKGKKKISRGKTADTKLS